MEKIKITPPSGYEVDKEKSTFEEIVFKKIEKKLPTKWEDFNEVYGYSMQNDKANYAHFSSQFSKTLWPTKELAEAAVALCRLVRFRDAWNDGWIPNWESKSELKHTIIHCENDIARSSYLVYHEILSFKTEEIRDKFLQTFRDLIETAKPLL